jgi:hypothetical protein
MLPHALLKVTTLSNILFAIIPIFQGLNAAPVSSVISLGKYVVAVAVAAAVEAVAVAAQEQLADFGAFGQQNSTLHGRMFFVTFK